MKTTEKEHFSPFRENWRSFVKNRLALSGLIIFVFFFVTAFCGLLLTMGETPFFDPAIVRLPDKLQPPLAKARVDNLAPEQVPLLEIYLLGTDDLGRDIFARMLQGAWVSLTIGFVAVGLAVFIGIIVGGTSGYYGHLRLKRGYFISLVVFGAASVIAAFDLYAIGGGVAVIGLFLFCHTWRIIQRPWAVLPDNAIAFFLGQESISLDVVIMRFVDIMLCFPSFFLILTVVALLPASIYNIMIIIGLTSWMGTARFVRAEFLSLKERDFVMAARALGVSDLQIIFRHLVPNAIAPVLVSATVGVASAILTEAGLSFLGFGVPPPHATWGNILSDGKRFLFDAPWLTITPGITILLVVLSFNLVGEGLREALDPKLRSRRH